MSERASKPTITGRRGLSEEVADYVRDRVMSGALRPGAFLRIDDIATLLEVSVTPVREGLLDLRGQGFLDLRPRRGFVVLPLRRSDFLDVFGMQSAFDGKLAERAAARATDSDIRMLERLQSDLVEAVEQRDTVRANELSYEFHQTINTIADAPKIAWLASVVDRYVPRRFFDPYPEFVEASVDDHAKILGAVRRRDPDAAREVMRAHVRRAGELLIGHLESFLDSDGERSAGSEASSGTHDGEEAGAKPKV